jgi:hypothetical protein
VQARLWQLPSLRRLILWGGSGIIFVKEVIGVLQSLPPTLQSLTYVCQGRWASRSLTPQLVEANKPAHMRLVQWRCSPQYRQYVVVTSNRMGIPVPAPPTLLVSS